MARQKLVKIVVFDESGEIVSGPKITKNHPKICVCHALYSIGKFSPFREHRLARSRTRKNHVETPTFS